MNTLLNTHRTSSAVDRTAMQHVSVHAGLLFDGVFGTNAGLPSVARWEEALVTVNTASAVRRITRPPGIPGEVRLLRDQICSYGLTRQDVARALGVDRRSLSGWVSGEIHPATERVRVLRLLARLVVDIDDEQPGHARDLLLSRRRGASLIDRVGTEGAAVLDSWRSSAQPAVTVTVAARSQRAGEPLWAAAASALAEGKLAPPTWERTVRPGAVYEMDLDEATAVEEPQPKHRRRGYQ